MDSTPSPHDIPPLQDYERELILSLRDPQTGPLLKLLVDEYLTLTYNTRPRSHADVEEDLMQLRNITICEHPITCAPNLVSDPEAARAAVYHVLFPGWIN